jgi:integrase
MDNASPFLRDYITVLAHTGLRSGELQRLKWEDIDFNNNLVRVEIAKSHRFRTIPMSASLRKLLTELHAQKGLKQIYIFECNEGKPVSDFYHRFKRLLKRLGIDGHVHKLRHTFASYLVQNGVSIYEVQQLLGHASVQTTQIYAHIRMDNLQKAVSTLDKNKSDGMETGRKEDSILRLA